MQLSRRAAVLLLVLLTSGGMAGFARADEATEAREHYKKGTKAFELGAYDEAITEYTAAYRLRDDPALLYNLAQAHRLANHPADALRFYRMFLIKTPNAPNRDEVDLKIRELQKLVEQQRKTQSLPPDSIKAPESVPTSEPPMQQAVSAPAHAVQVPPPVAGSRSSDAGARQKKIAGIAVASVGIGAIVGGIVCGVLAQDAANKLTKLDQNKMPFDYNLEHTGRTDQIVEGVLLGVGGAAVVAGVTVFVLGVREQRQARRVSVAPIFGRNIAGASFMGRF